MKIFQVYQMYWLFLGMMIIAIHANVDLVLADSTPGVRHPAGSAPNILDIPVKNSVKDALSLELTGPVQDSTDYHDVLEVHKFDEYCQNSIAAEEDSFWDWTSGGFWAQGRSTGWVAAHWTECQHPDTYLSLQMSWTGQLLEWTSAPPAGFTVVTDTPEFKSIYWQTDPATEDTEPEMFWCFDTVQGFIESRALTVILTVPDTNVEEGVWYLCDYALSDMTPDYAAPGHCYR